MATITKENGNITLNVNGSKYPVRYFSTREDGNVVAVLLVDGQYHSPKAFGFTALAEPSNDPNLEGKYGDEFLMSKVENYKNGKLTAVK